MQIEQLIASAEKHGASDLIVSPGTPPHLRIAGSLHKLETAALSGEEITGMLRKLISDTQLQTFIENRELDFAIEHGEWRMRGNAYLRDGDPAIALRLIPPKIPSIQELGLPTSLTELVQRTQGLFLFTGAAGQGKSTSMAALIDLLNQHYPRHIVTVEDPIEYLHRSRKCIIDQREVGRDTNSYGDALRHILRQNPDVILIGEMRDPETVQAALRVAETGHLVLSTLHTNDACQAVDRIVDMFPEERQNQIRSQLSLVLLAVVNQRLIKGNDRKLHLAAEVLVSNGAIAKLIRDGKTAQLYNALEIDPNPASCTMNHALDVLVNEEVIHPAEARRFRSRLESFALLGES